MNADAEVGTAADEVIRRAIGGDPGAVAWIVTNGESTDNATVAAMAALIGARAGRLARADAVATTRRDRQTLAITRAHLVGDHRLVDALARDHLVDFPDSYIVAWIASGAAIASGPEGSGGAATLGGTGDDVAT
jgi:hypothetical protein